MQETKTIVSMSHTTLREAADEKDNITQRAINDESTCSVSTRGNKIWSSVRFGGYERKNDSRRARKLAPVARPTFKADLTGMMIRCR